MRMNQKEANKQRVYAAARTGFDQLRDRLDPNTKRMAGAALIGYLAPGTLAAIDNQETGFNELAGGSLILGTGIGAGAVLGNKNVRIADKDEYVRQAMSDLKAKGKELAKKVGPEAARDFIALEKEKLMKDISPIAPRQAQAFNMAAKSMGIGGDILSDLDLLNRTPRQIRGTTRGMFLGTLATALPAYLAMRGGEIDA